MDNLIAFCLYWMAVQAGALWFIGRFVKVGKGPVACAHGCVGLCPDMVTA